MEFRSKQTFLKLRKSLVKLVEVLTLFVKKINI